MGRYGSILAIVVAGCAAEHARGADERALVDGLRASALARTARDEVVETCTHLAGIAGTASGRGGRVTFGTLTAGDEGWIWRPDPRDRLMVGDIEVRIRRIEIDDASGVRGEHDVVCAVGEVEVSSWRGRDEGEAWVRGDAGGVSLDLTHVGTGAAGGDVFEAIEGDAIAGEVRVGVRQTARREEDRYEAWIDDHFGIHVIDGASATHDRAGWIADGKVLAGDALAARLHAPGSVRLEWVSIAGARVPY